jgi:hypothetical protein
MKNFAYLSTNNLATKDVRIEDLYEGEKILSKSEEIKYED